jgi:hypothetical protein
MMGGSATIPIEKSTQDHSMDHYSSSDNPTEPYSQKRIFLVKLMTIRKAAKYSRLVFMLTCYQVCVTISRLTIKLERRPSMSKKTTSLMNVKDLKK